jgi:hypothetical protein
LSTLVVFSCDEKYFPLAKGLVLSLSEARLRESGITLTFIDIGCEPRSIAWLSEHGVQILPSSRLSSIPALANAKGYHLVTCMWALPFRDNAGLVRVPLPPNAPIGIVHLSMWSARRHLYYDHGLLFQQGRYLSDEERQSLLS